MAEEEPKEKIKFQENSIIWLGAYRLDRNRSWCWCISIYANPDPSRASRRVNRKKLQQAGQLPSADGEGEENAEPQKVYKDTPSTDTFVTSYYTFPDNFTTNLKASKAFLQVSVGVSTQYDETVIENVELHQLALRSEVLGVVSEFTVEQVEGKTGRDQLADSIKDAINARLEELEGFGGVEGYFYLLCSAIDEYA